MKIIKLSYSILNAWSMKRYEDAVGMYLGQSLPKTPQMELGSAYHDVWAKHIQETKTIPQEIGGGALIEPIVEQKYEKLIPLGKYTILIRGTPDLTDKDTIYEWKVGMAKATSYVDSLQLDYYKLLVPNLKLGIYRCYNPYFKTFGTGIKFLSDMNAEQALEHIVTFGGEIIDYMATQKLLVDYKPEIYLKQAEALA